jgi:hypothetical protein
MTYDVENPGLEKIEKCVMVKQVNGITTFLLDII